jgi:hypothetical protein
VHTLVDAHLGNTSAHETSSQNGKVPVYENNQTQALCGISGHLLHFFLWSTKSVLFAGLLTKEKPHQSFGFGGHRKPGKTLGQNYRMKIH